MPRFQAFITDMDGTILPAGKPLSEIIGTAEFPVEEWKQMQQDVT